MSEKYRQMRGVQSFHGIYDNNCSLKFNTYFRLLQEVTQITHFMILERTYSALGLSIFRIALC